MTTLWLKWRVTLTERISCWFTTETTGPTWWVEIPMSQGSPTSRPKIIIPRRTFVSLKGPTREPLTKLSQRTTSSPLTEIVRGGEREPSATEKTLTFCWTSWSETRSTGILTITETLFPKGGKVVLSITTSLLMKTGGTSRAFTQEWGVGCVLLTEPLVVVVSVKHLRIRFQPGRSKFSSIRKVTTSTSLRVPLRNKPWISTVSTQSTCVLLELSLTGPSGPFVPLRM